MKIINGLLVVMIFFSCHKPGASTYNLQLDQLADKTCKAISIRQQRFALANNIRFTQDSSTSVKSRNGLQRLQARIKKYMLQKDSLLKLSLTLAANIRLQLDSLIPYGDKNAQKRFTANLDSLLVKKRCMVKTTIK